MSLYGLGISRKHYLTQEAANNAIKKKEELINRLTKHTDTLRGWKQGWELEKPPKIARIKKETKTKIKIIDDGEKKAKKEITKIAAKEKKQVKSAEKSEIKEIKEETKKRKAPAALRRKVTVKRLRASGMPF